MRTMMFSALVLFSATILFAGDLRNEDSKGYNLEISQGAGTTHTSIGSNTTQMGAAKKGSKIKIKETGSTIEVTFDGDVLIKNGKLSKK